MRERARLLLGTVVGYSITAVLAQVALTSELGWRNLKVALVSALGYSTYVVFWQRHGEPAGPPSVDQAGRGHGPSSPHREPERPSAQRPPQVSEE